MTHTHVTAPIPFVEAKPYVGQPLRRREDRRLLTGKGRYVDDIRVPGMLHVAILRSPHAHAVITTPPWICRRPGRRDACVSLSREPISWARSWSSSWETPALQTGTALRSVQEILRGLSLGTAAPERIAPTNAISPAGRDPASPANPGGHRRAEQSCSSPGPWSRNGRRECLRWGHRLHPRRG